MHSLLESSPVRGIWWNPTENTVMGRSDVIVCDSENGRLAVFEVKCSAALEKMEESCETALRQIDERMYAKEFEDSYDQVLCYGISFYKKRCLVKKIHS